MPSYSYRAVHASGRIARGELNAANENELAFSLTQSGLELLDAKEKTNGLLSFSRKIDPRVLSAFCARFHDLLASDIAFPDALRDMQAATDNRVLADALTQISRFISTGKGLAFSFGMFPNLFSPLFIALLDAGEKTGDMARVFSFLRRYTANAAETRERLRKAIRYPLFLFFVAGSAVAFMLSMVVPQIIQFLNGIEGHIPYMTKLLISASDGFRNAALPLAIGTLILVLFLSIGRKYSTSVALFFDKISLRLPFLGNVIEKTEIARFAYSFSLLFQSGYTVASGLREARKTVANAHLSKELEAAEQRVLDGATLSGALSDILPPFATGLLRIGERTGKIGKSLDDIVASYDRETASAIDAFLGALEPGLTLAIGLVLAWTVLAVLGPLYGSLSVLGGQPI